MSKDLYQILGVPRDADEDAIKKAFRKLAMKYHPDKNPGKANEQRFKEVNQANEVLSDKEKRALYDEFGDVALSPSFDAERARAAKRWAGRSRGAGGPQGVNVEEIFGDGAQGMHGDIGEILGDLFGRGRGGPGGVRARAAARGQDLESEVTIDFLSAVRGTQIQLQRGDETVTVRVPAGAAEGSRLRIPGQGGPGFGGGPSGDLLVTVHVEPHPLFERKGDDLYLDVPITIGEAFAGKRIKVPTIDGEVMLKIPARAQSGQVMRLRGKGVAKKGKEPGDLYVRFMVLYPSSGDGDVEKAIEALEKRMSDPRGALKV